MIRAIAALIFCAAFWVLPSVAAVDSVTVFPDRATVTRVIEMNVSAGSGELIETDLPIGLSRDSLRISAEGPSGMRLGAYRLETVRGSERVNPRVRELESRLLELRDRQDVIDDAIQARDMQITLLRSLAGGAGQGEGRLAIEGWESALSTVGEGAEEVFAARRQLHLERREVASEIERLEREMADLGQQQRDTLALRLAYDSESSGRAAFTIEYTLSGAAWRPVYEWRLDTDTAQLEIIQLAEVRQRTGEDWENARLNLSLARPSAGGRLPELTPWWVDVMPPKTERVEVTGARMERAMMATDMAEDAPAPAPWDEAELAGSEYTQAWQIPGRVQVAADNQSNRFRLDTAAMDVELSARTVPRRQPTAWLYAQGVYEGDSALPPGMVTLYQDQTLVGQVRFSGIAPGGELASSFGVDDRIEVDYRLVEDKRSTEGMIRKSTRLTRVHEIEVVNGHARPIDITVLDQMPVSRDERIEVALTGNTTAPDERNVDDKPGVLAWHRSLDAGAAQQLTIGYRLTFPEDLEGVQGW